MTTEQDGTPEHGATSELADEGDDELAGDGDDELTDEGDDELTGDGDDAQPAMADSAVTTTSTVPTRPVIGRP